MNTLLLMAGKAERFKNSKYQEYKPFIQVGSKKVVDWTLKSLDGYANKLHIAVHNNNGYEALGHFYNNYGLPREKFCIFDEYTNGNLETAYLASKCFNFDPHESLLVLDCDNYYECPGLYYFLDYSQANDYFPKDGYVVVFEPKDNSNKWAFAIVDKETKRVKEIREKDNSMGGYPMVGVFWFRKAKDFMNMSAHILSVKNKEHFMSECVSEMAKHGYTIGYKTAINVVPLGTPEDIDCANLS